MWVIKNLRSNVHVYELRLCLRTKLWKGEKYNVNICAKNIGPFGQVMEF